MHFRQYIQQISQISLALSIHTVFLQEIHIFIVTLISQAEKQTQLLKKCMKHSETVTLASYQLAWNFAQAKKSYNELDFYKKMHPSVRLL